VTRGRRTLIACILGSGIAFLDSTVVNVALPAIRRDLGTGLTAQQWIVEAYLLTLGSMLLVGGSLGDALGRRRIFSLGLAGFGVTSLLCAVAPSAGVLAGARALQGVAGALLVPSSLAIITATFDAEERGRAIGTWTAWTGVAMVVGPLGGGLIVDAISWRFIFAINIPLVLVNLWLLTGIDESVDEEAGGHIDVWGAVLCALGLAGPVFALTEQPDLGWGDPLVLGPLLAGAALLGVFLDHERRTAHPMLPLEIFRSRNFAVGNLATFTIYGGLGVATFFVTIFLQQVAGWSAVGAGLSLLPVTVIMWLLSSRFGALSARIGPRLLMGLGPIVAGVGLIWLGRSGARPGYLADLLGPVVLFGLGLSATVAPLTNTVLGAVPQHHAGVASGANNAIARVASLVAIAAIGAVVAARYETALDSTVAAGPPLTAAERHALPAARGRPLAGSAGGGPRLDGAVRDASVSAYHYGLGVGGGLVVAGGIISLIGIANPKRRARADDVLGVVEHDPGASRLAHPCPGRRTAA
jgi:EmrB/QacA subfamily drug resistance transporter